MMGQLIISVHFCKKEEKTITELLSIFPLHIRTGLGHALRRLPQLEEIRIRINQPVILSVPGKEYFLMPDGGITENSKAAYVAAEQDIKDMMVFISRYSLYAFEEEIRNGFLTLEGGHRVGISGQAVFYGEKLHTIRNISCLNIRISHEKKDCALPLVHRLYKTGEYQSGIYNTLLLSPPGMGKTTLLRDLARLLSNGSHMHAGLKVSIVDERSEIAGCFRGIPQNEVGMRTDVLDGCPKSLGMMLMLRTMSPQVLVVDELGNEEDIRAVTHAVNCGCGILGTVHATDLKELKEKPGIGSFARSGCFERFLTIGQQKDGTRLYQLYDREQELIC